MKDRNRQLPKRYSSVRMFYGRISALSNYYDFLFSNNPFSETGVGMSNVTVLGLGTMGQALARALLKAGHKVTVWNRTAGKDSTLVAEGAIRAISVDEAVRTSSVIIVCMLDYPSVRAVLEPVEHRLSGLALFNLTTGRPDEVRSMSDWASTWKTDYIDGGIMAVPSLIGTRDALILYSGVSENTFNDNRSLLEAMGQARYVGADPDLASVLDLAANAAVTGMIGGAVHAITMARAKNVELISFTRSLLVPYLNKIVDLIPHFAQ